MTKPGDAFKSGILLILLCILFPAVTWAIIGYEGIFTMIIFAVLVIAIMPSPSAGDLIEIFNAGPLDENKYTDTIETVGALAGKAGLAPPGLFRFDDPSPNALSIGAPPKSTIALSDTMLKTLDRRELKGILAHEIAHIKNNDIWLLEAAGALSRIASYIALFGVFMMVVNLRLVLIGEYDMAPPAMAFVIVAPFIARLLRLAFSRTRERVADMGAVDLTGDPEGLALALEKMMAHEPGNPDEAAAPPTFKTGFSQLLMMHPSTEARVQRLRKQNRTG